MLDFLILQQASFKNVVLNTIIDNMV